MSDAPMTEGLSADYAPSEENYIGDTGVFHNVGAGVAIHVGTKTDRGLQRSTFIIEPYEAISFAILLTKLAYRALRENKKTHRESQKAKRDGSRS